MSFTYEKKKDKAGDFYIEITGGMEEMSKITIPETIENFPVKSIASSAFSRRKELEEAVLPESIYSLGRYAFYNCTNLKRLTLCDGIEDFYDGVTKLCENLSYVKIRFGQDNYTVIKDLLADNDRALHFTLQGKKFGEMKEIKLTFPAYVYDFVEDVEARVLHHKIEGAGYPYRECVTRKGIDFRAYDNLFYQAVTDDYRVAADIAFDRLMFPFELEQGAKENYEQFLLNSSQQLVTEFVEEDEFEKINFLLEQVLLTKEGCQEAIDFSVAEKKAEFTAMFMEYDRTHFHRYSEVEQDKNSQGNQLNLSLELDDW